MRLTLRQREHYWLAAFIVVCAAWALMNVAFGRELPEAPFIMVMIFCAMCSSYYQGRRHERQAWEAVTGSGDALDAH